MFFADREFHIGSLRFRQAAFGLENYNCSVLLEDVLGENCDGILGMEEIRSKNWLFDLKAKTVTISDGEIGIDRIGSPQDLCLAVIPDSIITYVDVLLNDSLRRTFLFDTGWISGTMASFEDKEYYWQTGLKISNSVFQKLKPLTPVNGHLQFISEMKINNLKMDTIAVYLTEKINALNYMNPMLVGKDSCTIGFSFLKYFDYMLIDSDNHQIRFYGYHANNQGERDFIKAMKSKK